MIIKEAKKASMEDPQNQAGAEICFDILVTDVEKYDTESQKAHRNSERYFLGN